VRIAGSSARRAPAVFYTALYHALLQPLTGNDADGRYRGYDERIHLAKGWTYYEYFSLWDTYRAQNQLLAMLRPQRARDIARSLLEIHEQVGWLPRWGYANFDTNVMTGDPVTPFLVDLWRFGALAWRGADRHGSALWQNANGRPPAMSRAQGRAGNDSLPARRASWPTTAPFPRRAWTWIRSTAPRRRSSTRWPTARWRRWRRRSAKTTPPRQLSARGGNWRNAVGRQRARRRTPAFAVSRVRANRGRQRGSRRRAAPTSPRSQHGFHEGTAWQYQWLVPQDVPGLVAAMGGKDNAGKRLDAFFAYDALLADPSNAARKQWVVGSYDYYNQFRYNPNNEPDLHAPWMYTLIGEPAKTAVVLRAAQSLFTNAPNGVTGNDDLGTMSAWYLFSAIGLYPAMPGTGRLLMHPPRFERIVLDIGDGKTLRIEAPGAGRGSVRYIENVTFDGAPSPHVWLDWDRLRDGGTLRFALGDTPGAWGTAPGDLPPAACAAQARSQ
jgi:putative alpha-1,2-mannosidase